MSDSDAWGSTEKTSTLWPFRARWYAVAAENVVFPSPPFPPNMMYRRSGLSVNIRVREISATFGRGSGSSEGVRQILLAKHPPLPRRDLGDDVREQAQRVVRGQDGDAEEISHRDEDEQVLHAPPGLQRLPGHLVRGHAVDEVLDLALEAREEALAPGRHAREPGAL